MPANAISENRSPCRCVEAGGEEPSLSVLVLVLADALYQRETYAREKNEFYHRFTHQI
jgi:hypothetical protein